MKNTKKKGFTLVELLVVIAILAVLATVAVVGYTNFIAQANASADQQAVAQMNIALEAEQTIDSLIVENNDAQTSINIFKALVEAEYNDEFVPLYKKHSFAYIVDGGKAFIVLVEDEKVVYPEKYAEKTDYKAFFTAVENSKDLTAAFETGSVLLKTNSSFKSVPEINKDLTLVGNNKTIEANVNLTVDSSKNAAFSVKGANEDIEVNMSGVNIVNPEKTYARGLNISDNDGKITMVLDNCDIEAHHYALNIAGANKEGVDIVVKNSTLEGYAAVNIWSKANVTFENCTIIGNDISNGEQSGYAAVVVNGADGTARIGDAAKDSVLTFNNCKFEIRKSEKISQIEEYWFVMANTDCTINLNNCSFKIDGANVSWDKTEHLYTFENAVDDHAPYVTVNE